MTEQIWLWIGLNVFIVAMLALEIYVSPARALKAATAS